MTWKQWAKIRIVRPLVLLFLRVVSSPWWPVYVILINFAAPTNAMIKQDLSWWLLFNVFFGWYIWAYDQHSPRFRHRR